MLLTPLDDGVVDEAFVDLVGTQRAAVFHVDVDFQFVVGANILDTINTHRHATLVGFCQGDECVERYFIHVV